MLPTQNAPRFPKCTPLFSRDEWLERYALLSGGVTDSDHLPVQLWLVQVNAELVKRVFTLQKENVEAAASEISCAAAIVPSSGRLPDDVVLLLLPLCLMSYPDCLLR